MGEVVEKPWGYYEDLHRQPQIVLKKLVVKPGEATSFQSHENHYEFWVVEEGVGELWTSAFTHPDRDEDPLNDYNIRRAQKGSFLNIPVGFAHRIVNVGGDDLVLWEVQFGTCDEDDVIIYKDKYGRE